MDPLFSGAGPGVQTPDGSSVEFYRQLPYLGELDPVLGLVPARASVLELGCGTGRLCAHLAGIGCRVTGVDESAYMLAHLPAAVASVCSSIEALALPQTFDVVLLASHLINHPSTASRAAFAACARRHLQLGGLFLLQRHNPTWLNTVAPGYVGAVGPVALHVEAVSRDDHGVRLTLRWQASAGTWWQSFATVPLDEREIEALLLRVGFTQVRWHGEPRLWASAVAQ